LSATAALWIQAGCDLPARPTGRGSCVPLNETRSGYGLGRGSGQQLLQGVARYRILVTTGERLERLVIRGLPVPFRSGHETRWHRSAASRTTEAVDISVGEQTIVSRFMTSGGARLVESLPGGCSGSWLVGLCDKAGSHHPNDLRLAFVTLGLDPRSQPLRCARRRQPCGPTADPPLRPSSAQPESAPDAARWACGRDPIACR
jgi:hypothetical protein